MKLLRGLSPIARVLLGLALGVLLGVFVGEPAGVLSIGGDIYIRLLQMTVLPYILVSLIVGLGGLDAEMARRIGLRGGLKAIERQAGVGRPGALADRVIEMIETPELVSELSSRGRATADVHRWSKVSRRWLGCYHGLLSTTPIRDAIPRCSQRVSVPLQTPISSK